MMSETAQPTNGTQGPTVVTTSTTNGAPPVTVATAPQAAVTPQPSTEKQPPWGRPENFDPDKAWELIQSLRTEHVDPQIRSEFDALKQQQEQQREAVAAMLGIKPTEVSDTDKLREQLNTVQDRIMASERRALAAEHRVPENLLTATDSEALKAQAVALEEFAKAAHYAAATEAPPPAFVQNPGQGQGNTPLTQEAQELAEFNQFYPPVER